MKTDHRLCCADCRTTACDEKDKIYPDFCLTKELTEDQKKEMLDMYFDEENSRLAKAAALVEHEGYLKETRVEETIHFAEKIGAGKIGIACCVGLIREAGIMTEILRSRGFDVVCVACKLGALKKIDAGIDPVCEKTGVSMCNPIGQAMYLEGEGTDLNIVMGLCVGHDSLFYKYSKAVTTTLVVKDRVLGHNPAAALYTADTYYSRLKK